MIVQIQTADMIDIGNKGCSKEETAGIRQKDWFSYLLVLLSAADAPESIQSKFFTMLQNIRFSL